jgi:hypothetical protein
MKIGIASPGFFKSNLTEAFSEKEVIRKHTSEVASIDFPRRLVSIPSIPVEVRKGRPGFLGPAPMQTRRVYIRSERAR